MGNIPPAEPTRLTSGVTTDQNIENLGFYGLPDPAKFHTEWNDFDQFGSEFVVTTGGAGGAVNLSSSDGGILELTTNAGIGSIVQAQRTPTNFTFELGKKSFFKTKIRVGDSDSNLELIGLFELNPLASTFTSGLMFESQAGTDVFFLRIRKVGPVPDTIINLSDLVNTVFVEVGFYFNGIDKIQVFENNQKIGTAGIESLELGVPLSFGVFTENLTSSAHVQDNDYYFIAKER